MLRDIRTLFFVFITVLSVNQTSAQSWQNATNGSGILPIADFAVCQHRLSMLALPTNGSTSVPNFRTFYLTTAIGTAQGTNPMVGGLRSTISGNDFDVLRPFMPQNTSIDFNRPAALNVRPRLFPGTGFTVSVNQGGPSGTVGVVPQPDVQLNAFPPYTFFVEKNCPSGQISGGVVIVGSAAKVTTPPIPPRTGGDTTVRASFNFPFMVSNGTTYRLVATSLFRAQDLPFNNTGSYFGSVPGGPIGGSLSLSRPTGGSGSSQNGWNGTFVSPILFGPTPSTPISVSIFVIESGPNGVKVVATGVFTTPN